MYLNEKEVSNLRDAEVKGDEFALIHKRSNIHKKVWVKGSPSAGDSNSKTYEKSGGSSRNTQNDSDKLKKYEKLPCWFCKAIGHPYFKCKKWEETGKPTMSKPEKAGMGHLARKITNDNVKMCDKPSKCVTEKQINVNVDKSLPPFMSVGTVSLSGSEAHKVNILRDTGAQQSLLLSSSLPVPMSQISTNESVIIQGVGGNNLSLPLIWVNLQCGLVKGKVQVGVTKTLPMNGVQFLLGNDLAGGEVSPLPHMCTIPSEVDEDIRRSGETYPELFKSCVVTRSQRRELLKDIDNNDDLELPMLFDDEDEHIIARSGNKSLNVDNDKVDVDPVRADGTSDRKSTETNTGSNINIEKDGLSLKPGGQFNDLPLKTSDLIAAQHGDPSLNNLWEKVVSEEEIENQSRCYFMKHGVLSRKWRPPDAPPDDSWRVHYQIVVPTQYRDKIVKLTHDTPMAGHLGVRKTYDRLLRHFFWHGAKKYVSNHCKTCHICQMAGKPHQKPPRAPLQPVPAFEEPFSTLIIDCVGPLPRTGSEKQYILCSSTRFPEAVPLRSIRTPAICEALKGYFSFFGLPTVIRSDCGSNFQSKQLKKLLKELGIEHITSSVYHPQSQGALERFHGTLKNMLRAYCTEHHNDWDVGLPFLLFAARDSVQESLGFSPNELVFGHTVRGPLKLIKDKWLSNKENGDVCKYVIDMKNKLASACKTAKSHLFESQDDMKR